MIGRELEFAAICDVIERARRGRAASIALCGEAGIGKTTLLDAVRLQNASNVHVLATQGRAADAEIGYSSLLTLLRPVEHQLDALAGPHADAVRAALMMDRNAVDPIAVQVGVFRVISALAEQHTVLLVIDDAHHLDAATAAALAFAIGRLDADPVATLLAVDPSGPSVWIDMAVNTLTLGPLGDNAIAAIVREEVAIDESVLAHCCRISGGNPLAALELARSLSPAERAGTVPTPLVPRLKSGLAHGFRSRLEDAGALVQRVMVVVAADDTGEVDVIRHALAALGESVEGLSGAEASGLIVIDGGSVRLSHPLLRSVAYHQVAPSSRRAAHWALAASLVEAHHGAAKAWQLVAAADGHDDGAADALDLVALDALRRGGPASAARISERAAILSSDTISRARRIAGAATAWFAAGEIDRCRTCLDQLGALPITAETLVAAGMAALWTDGPRRAQQRIHHLAGRVDSSLVPIARVLSVDLAVAAGFMEGLGDIGAELLADPDVGSLAADVLSRVSGSVKQSADRITVGPLAPLAGLRRRRASVELGRLSEVASDMAELSPLAGLVLPSGVDDQLTTIAARRHAGELNQASASAGLAMELLPESAQLPNAAVSVALADIECLLGRHDDARGRLERAVPVLAEYGYTELSAFASWVQGRLDRDAGDIASSLDSLERAARLRPHLYGSDFAIAVVLGDETDDRRRRLVAGCAHLAKDTLRGESGGGTDWKVLPADPLVQIRRLRAAAVLHDDPELFLRSAFMAANHRLRVEEAETWLAASEWATHTGDTKYAAESTERALELLGRIGARFGQRRLVPETVVSDVEELLSPAESRVALAVAEGMTNKEVATALFVSVKTVDFHLQGIYRKLSVRSRTELAVRMNRRTVVGSRS
jgi:DNA-binding CsgD family transcriptional regulator/tetratricopeptide (TPR) repeat protein